MSGEQDIGATLPALERQVFEAVKAHGAASVADVVATLQAAQRPLAYTTVMTVLGRLWQKGYLIRQREGRTYSYQALSGQQIGASLSAKAAQDLLARYGDVALAGFVHTLTAEQRQILARLLNSERPPVPPGASE